jgi:hypothetical protein
MNQSSITIKYIRDYILDNHITEYDTIVMNMVDFDDILLEHRQTYGSSINAPFFLLNVLVEPDDSRNVNRGQFKVIRNNVRQRTDNDGFEDDQVPEETVYCCGWCGNIVDYDGTQVSNEVRKYHILVLQKYGASIAKRVQGYCCENKKR